MTYAFIQARMGSIRLPGKVMREIAGKPMLQWVVERAQAIPDVKVRVCTSSHPNDDPIERWCRREGVHVTRGSHTSVLQRFAQSAENLQENDTIIRVTGDCPLLDPDISEQTLQWAWDAQEVPIPFACNTQAWPDGLDTEVFPQWLLMEAADKATTADEHEHVTPWMRCYPHTSLPGPELRHLKLRHLKWSVDTEADLSFVQTVYAALGPTFGWRDVLNLKVGDVCKLCKEGVSHSQRSYTSIGGKRDYTVWDLHEVEDASGAGIVECLAAALHEPHRIDTLGGCSYRPPRISTAWEAAMEFDTCLCQSNHTGCPIHGMLA